MGACIPAWEKMGLSRFWSMNFRGNRGLMNVRSCGLCGGDEDSRPRKSVGHTPGLHRRMLRTKLVAIHKCEWVVLTLLARVAVHVCLQRARPSKTLVANFTLVLLLCAGGELGVELAHHGLRRRR